MFEIKSSYRIQLRNGVDFDVIRYHISYFKKLGISHLYLSPIFKAGRGSSHGYDIVDFNEICPSLGGRRSFEHLVDALRINKMGLILDIVPNHMLANAWQNSWWRDLLRAGPYSTKLRFFDVDYLQKGIFSINLALLDDSDDSSKKKNNLQVKFFRYDLSISVNNDLLPVNLEGLSYFLSVMDRVGSNTLFYKSRHFLDNILSDIEKVGILDAIYIYQKAYHEFNRIYAIKLKQNILNHDELIKSLRDEKILKNLLELQYYQIIPSSHSSAEINYRRFFNINDLICMRMQDDNVFYRSHQLISELVHLELIDGIRVDHIDGLFDPEKYLSMLRDLCPHIPIFVEKILRQNEQLPKTWPINGSTGYEFISKTNVLLTDHNARIPFENLWARFCDSEKSDDSQVVQIKYRILNDHFLYQLNHVAKLCADILIDHSPREIVDHKSLLDLLSQILARVSIYRTYMALSNKGIGSDKKVWLDSLKRLNIDEMGAAKTPLSESLREIFEKDALSARELVFIKRLELLCAPSMAKGLEDTFFYRSNLFLAFNEVGSDPRDFGMRKFDFYSWAEDRAKRYGLLASSTHDTKRSEDARLRLLTFSEVPSSWCAFISAVEELTFSNPQYEHFDREAFYHIFQVMVSVWPIDKYRLEQYALKASREAKKHTSWKSINSVYESSVKCFIRFIYKQKRILALIEDLVEEIELGSTVKSLVSVVLRHTLPGIPDIYQGCEVFNYKLVDPDNRQVINFGELKGILTRSDQYSGHPLHLKMDKDLVKLCLISRLLHFRNQNPEIFSDQNPLKKNFINFDSVEKGIFIHECLISFQRKNHLWVILPRYYLRDKNKYSNVIVNLSMFSNGCWDLISQRKLPPRRYKLSDLWSDFPMSILVM